MVPWTPSGATWRACAGAATGSSSKPNWRPRSPPATPAAGLCSLTFDDAPQDNATTLLELLEELDVPATVFACPGLLGEPWPFIDPATGIRLCRRGRAAAYRRESSSRDRLPHPGPHAGGRFRRRGGRGGDAGIEARPGAASGHRGGLVRLSGMRVRRRHPRQRAERATPAP